MKKRHEYVICTKKGKNNEPITYSYGQTKNIELSVSRQAFMAKIERPKLLRPQDIVNDNLFRDVIRKAAIVHLLKYSESITIDELYIIIDAISKGIYTSDETGNTWWWLRSPGGDSRSAAYVYDDGSVDNYGNYVNFDNRTVRPALWVDLGNL